MKTIPLTKGLVAMIDDEDFNRVSAHKWTPTFPRKNRPPYAHRSVKIDGKWKHISLHRFIMNAQSGVQVDHADGNSLNNQKSNLRFSTQIQNSRNMKCHNKNGLKGLNFRSDSSIRPWVAQISIEGTNKIIGRFSSKIDAAIAYNCMAIKHFGEFAKLNPIPFTYTASI